MLPNYTHVCYQSQKEELKETLAQYKEKMSKELEALQRQVPSKTHSLVQKCGSRQPFARLVSQVTDLTASSSKYEAESKMKDAQIQMLQVGMRWPSQ